jgi:hypothetical protein
MKRPIASCQTYTRSSCLTQPRDVPFTYMHISADDTSTPARSSLKLNVTVGVTVPISAPRAGDAPA